MNAKEKKDSNERRNASPVEPEGGGATPNDAQPAPGDGGETSGVGIVDRTAELEQRVASLEDSLLRARADFQNLQKRAARERSDAIVYGNAELMKSLLVVLDDFERSMKALDGGADPATVVQGVKLTYENLRKTLGDQGLEEIPAIGRAFDPTVHEALVHQPTKDHAAGTVMDVIVRGYRLRDRVVRPTRVVVAKPMEGDRATGSDCAADSAARAGECAANEQASVATE